uniref:Copper-containing nitrite reductase n=1 Tax=Globodera pallida TaxID=36090 RepID=A0A183CQ77_GLOPA
SYGSVWIANTTIRQQIRGSGQFGAAVLAPCRFGAGRLGAADLARPAWRQH